VTDHIPTKAVWLNIPDTCSMRGEFDPDHRLEFMFGGLRDGVNVVFERQALERFVTLANTMLAIPASDDTQVDLPKLQAPAVNNSYA
jgi:hypothetical protein